MLATRAPLGEVVSDEWAGEFKWDGVRVLVEVLDGGVVRMWSRNGNEITGRYPELHPLAAAIGRPAVLDGEVVAFDERQRPSFSRLQHRMHLTSEVRVRQAMSDIPVAIVLFDVLALGSDLLVQQPWTQRRETLEGLDLTDGRWQTSPAQIGGVATMLEIAQAHELEGVVAKRITSPYEVGERSKHWRKLRLVLEQEFVVGGYQRSRTGTGLGSLLLGVHDEHGDLVFAGSAGSGLRGGDLAAWQADLDARAVTTSPFAGPPTHLASDEYVHASPDLVAQVRFSQWTPEGRLRQPTYRGRRDDVDVDSIIREHRAPQID